MRRPVDAQHAEHVCPLGLVADVEGDVAAGCAHLTEELVADGVTQLTVGQALKVPLERDEFPVDESLPMATTVRLMAVVSVCGLEPRRLQWRAVLRAEQIELTDVRADLVLLGACPSWVRLDVEPFDGAGTYQGQRRRVG